MGSEVKSFFLKVVMSHIKLKGMEQREPCKHICCPYTHPFPWGGVKRSHAAYPIKGYGTKRTIQATNLFLHTLSTTCQNILLSAVMLHIKSKGMEAPCKHILCPYVHPQLKDLKEHLNVVKLHIKLKEKSKD